jgi:hypothetical protein
MCCFEEVMIRLEVLCAFTLAATASNLELPCSRAVKGILAADPCCCCCCCHPCCSGHLWLQRRQNCTAGPRKWCRSYAAAVMLSHWGPSLVQCASYAAQNNLCCQSNLNVVLLGTCCLLTNNLMSTSCSAIGTQLHIAYH